MPKETLIQDQHDLRTPANEANVRLHRLYEEILPMWRTLHGELEGKGHNLSIPFFVDVRPEYLTSAKRVVFVGQETHGWWTDWKDYVSSRAELSVPRITRFYCETRAWLLREYPSPYWQALRHLALAFDLPASCIVFSNLFPCDVDKKQPPIELHEALRSWSILPQELEILRPDYVVFFCGPDYFFTMHQFFGVHPEGKLSAARPFLSYNPPNVPWRGVISYHPNYLRLSKQWSVLDQMVLQLRSSQ